VPILNPFTFMMLQWVLRQGAPFVLRRFAPSPPAAAQFEGDATFERGPEAVRGLLSITSSELVFTPNSIRMRGSALRVPLMDVEDVSPVRRRWLGVFPTASNAIKVRTRFGIYRFVIDRADRDRWLIEVRAARAQARRASERASR